MLNIIYKLKKKTSNAFTLNHMTIHMTIKKMYTKRYKKLNIV